ncbi:hypothetical protein [Amycolatopsis sp. WAC 04182]|uniref:hypothetical protein n=1 Tax=unclassified Amycolatopsis TaxID=2618356 RepID=UPI000F7851D5|nr:hypothetical protein [Amycolatopsis sp. WAC 04182]RSN60520.1 hypothetical protein DMH01_14530 [Amycolatopsis sp. WAC 04182]
MAYPNNRVPLTPRDTTTNPHLEIVVGWDRGMQTYFAQVFNGTNEYGEDIMLVDIGTRVGEITYPGAVIDAVRPYADIPDDLGRMLAAQREADTSTYGQLRREAGHVARAADLAGIDITVALTTTSPKDGRTQAFESTDDDVDGGEHLGRGMGY